MGHGLVKVCECTLARGGDARPPQPHPVSLTVSLSGQPAAVPSLRCAVWTVLRSLATRLR